MNQHMNLEYIRMYMYGHHQVGLVSVICLHKTHCLNEFIRYVLTVMLVISQQPSVISCNCYVKSNINTFSENLAV